MRHTILIPAILWFSAGALAQAGNDSCLNALFVGAGTPTQATNAGATTGPEPIGSCLQMGADVWFAYVPTCTGPHLATTCDAGTSFDTVLAVWDGLNGCSALIPLGCNDDSCGGLSSSVSFQAAVGGLYYISVGGYYAATGNFVLKVGPGSGSGIVLGFDNLGPGTIGFTVTGGAPYGSFISVMSLNQGAFPNGWFFGIDVLPFELQLMLGFGYPFNATLDQCGSFAFGPVGGAPSGLSVYGVVLGFSVGTPVPTAISSPATTTIP